MNILLTGAAGFTGLAFTKFAQSQGHTVIPLQADLRDRAAVHSAVIAIAQQHTIESVLHLAGVSFVAHENVAEFSHVHIDGTLNLLEALSCLQPKPSHIVLASSATVYDASYCDRSGKALDEDSPTIGQSAYAISKLAMERAAQNHYPNLPIIIARPFNYTGPGQAGHFLIPKLVAHFAQQASRIALGNIEVEREFNDVTMVCQAYLALLAFGQAGQTYNLCSGQSYSLMSIVRTLSDLTHHQIAIEIDPKFVRAHDPARIVGNPQKLQQLFKQHNLPWESIALTQTLTHMLGASAALDTK
jgi:nucleoside-diphosphate-sugar epimerase